MINETLLKSNVLRRIYTDSLFEASQSKAQGVAALRACNAEAGSRMIVESQAHKVNVQAAYNELMRRKESIE